MTKPATTIIRQATGEDVDAIHALYHGLELKGFIPLTDADSFRESLQRVIDYPDCFVFVAVSGDKVVGSLTVYLYEDAFVARKLALLENIVIADEARGSGLGRKLVDYGVRFATDQGALQARVMSKKVRKQAAKFYQDCGFEHIHNCYTRWLE